jgi:hypothetical protein
MTTQAWVFAVGLEVAGDNPNNSPDINILAIPGGLARLVVDISETCITISLCGLFGVDLKRKERERD